MPLLVIPTRVNLVFSESLACHRHSPTAAGAQEIGSAGDGWMVHVVNITAARRGGQRASSYYRYMGTCIADAYSPDPVVALLVSLSWPLHLLLIQLDYSCTKIILY